MLYSIFDTDEPQQAPDMAGAQPSNSIASGEDSGAANSERSGSLRTGFMGNALPLEASPQTQSYYKHTDFTKKVPVPKRYLVEEQKLPPPPLAEIEANMTRYLHTLHSRFMELAGPTVDAMEVWQTFMDITKEMPMTWDAQNYHRFPMPRNDKSIFVSLGTYRDPFCPMTIKSLYSNARHPERLFVGMFQQNCFGPRCRTGVLKGGKVEDAGPDMDCYVEFCKSPEGQRSNACTNGHVHLFNVNESESLGPYMARYLGAKFYRGEQYYLQIDSHSEFVENWDEKLIKMVGGCARREARDLYLSTRLADALARHHRVPHVRLGVRTRADRVADHPAGQLHGF